MYFFRKKIENIEEYSGRANKRSLPVLFIVPDIILIFFLR